MGTWPDEPRRRAGCRATRTRSRRPARPATTCRGRRGRHMRGGGLQHAFRTREQGGHVPVMLDRVLALLAPALSAPGAVARRRQPRPRRARRGAARRPPPAPPHRHRPRPRRDRARPRRGSRRTPSASPWCGRSPTSSRRCCAEPATPGSHGVAVRPRGLLARSSTRPGAASPTPTTRRSTCGWTASGAHRRGHRQHLPVAELTRVLREYGEERFAARIAEPSSGSGPGALTSTTRLAEIVRDGDPRGDPAHRRQPRQADLPGAAHRGERGARPRCERALPAALDALAVGGRIVVLSYHSLEDRLVKRASRRGPRTPAPPGLPVPLPAHQPRFRLLTRGAELRSDEEVTRNPRAASARLRAAERIRQG